MAYLDRLTTARTARTGAAAERWTWIRSVDDFALCDDAELIRVFPRLLPRDGTVPAAIRAQLLRCLAVLAWRSASRGDEAARHLLRDAPGLVPADVLSLGLREHGRWFPAGGASQAGSSDVPTRDGAVDERAGLVLLEALRREIAAGALRAFDADTATLFAHATGVHPAYLWPEALVSHEFFTAVGWLGQLRRRGRADMAADIADYFDDVIDVAPDGAPRLRDPDLTRFLPPDLLDDVRRAVRTHRRGSQASVRWPVAGRAGDRSLEAERRT